MRPSKGLISVSGILPLKAFKDTAGPMARTAEEMAILLEAMAGTDPDDDYTVEANADWMAGNGYTDDLSKNGLVGTKIGYLNYSFGTEYSSPNEKVMPMLETAIANLEGAGAEIVDISDILTTGMIEELTSDINTDTSATLQPIITNWQDPSRIRPIRIPRMWADIRGRHAGRRLLRAGSKYQR